MLKTLIATLLLGAAVGFPAQETAPPPQQNTQVEAGGSTVKGKADVNQAVNDRKNDKKKDNNNPSPPKPPKTPAEPKRTTMRTNGPHCGANTDICDPPAKKKTTTAAKAAPSSTQLREVVAKLRLPDPTPRLGPDPSVNEWNMLAVGYPIWLWTDHPTQLTTTAHHDGLTFTLEATRTNTSFTMGDGNTKQCATTTPYPGYTRNTSPTCSYTYDTPSPVGHPYTLTATTTWNITWATGTHHGTLTHTTTGTRTLDVGELQSLIIG